MGTLARCQFRRLRPVYNFKSHCRSELRHGDAPWFGLWFTLSYRDRFNSSRAGYANDTDRILRSMPASVRDSQGVS